MRVVIPFTAACRWARHWERRRDAVALRARLATVDGTAMREDAANEACLAARVPEKPCG
jgi:hypothetical protein